MAGPLTKPTTCRIVLFTDSYQRTGSRSFRSTWIGLFWTDLFKADVNDTRKLTDQADDRVTNLCIWIDLDQILPKKGNWIVDPSTQTFRLYKLSPLNLGNVPCNCFWPKGNVPRGFICSNPGDIFQQYEAEMTFNTWPYGGISLAESSPEPCMLTLCRYEVGLQGIRLPWLKTLRGTRPAPIKMKSTSSSGRGFPASKLETGFHFVDILLKHNIRAHSEKTS